MNLYLAGHGFIVRTEAAASPKVPAKFQIKFYCKEDTEFDTGWEPWDLQCHGRPWSCVEVRTVQEDHGSGKRLLRATFRLRVSTAILASGAGVILALIGWAATTSIAVMALALPVLGAGAAIWAQGRRLTAHVAGAFDQAAHDLRMTVCGQEKNHEGL